MPGQPKPDNAMRALPPDSQIRHLMKKTPNGLFWTGAVALSLAALFTACQSTPTRTAAELRRLQGYWEGEGLEGKCSITITGNSLHFYARTDFWYKTTFTLLAGTDPRVLRITIKDCSGEPPAPISKVVFALFKIEEGTLTLASPADGEAGRPQRQPKSFDDENLSIIKLRKVQPQKSNTEPPKTK